MNKLSYEDLENVNCRTLYLCMGLVLLVVYAFSKYDDYMVRNALLEGKQIVQEKMIENCQGISENLFVIPKPQVKEKDYIDN